MSTVFVPSLPVWSVLFSLYPNDLLLLLLAKVKSRILLLLLLKDGSSLYYCYYHYIPLNYTLALLYQCL